MSDIEKLLKDVVYGGVGAVASALETTGELAKTFVEKGQATVRQGQEKAEELKQSIREACKQETGIDLNSLTRAQRDELLRQLQAMAEAEDAAAGEAPVEETPTEEAAPTEEDSDEEANG